MAPVRLRLAAVVVACMAAVPALTQTQSPRAELQPYVEKVAGTLVTFEMMPVARGAGQRGASASGFWIMKTEATWDLYDVYVFELDSAVAAPSRGVDAVTRPTKPYVLPGDSYGHKGYPAIGMSLHAAKEFARWLSLKTGKTYRLPTDAEWSAACSAGHPAALRSPLSALAWHAGNADEKTHPVASLAPDALGLHDMLGNAAEWVTTTGDSVVAGGGFVSDSTSVSCSARLAQTRAWNVTDPQLPKSRWWLTDAFFVGVRLIRVIE